MLSDASEEYADGDQDSQENKTQTSAPEISIEWWQKELCKPEVLQLQPTTTYLRLPMLGRYRNPLHLLYQTCNMFL